MEYNNDIIDTSEFMFKGKHAEYVFKLTSEFDTKQKLKLFNRNIDVLIFSSIVGFLYNRKATVDNDNSIKPVKINYQQLVREDAILKYNYELIMLLANKESIDSEERLNRAFRYVDDKEKKSAGDNVYISYVLGGVEVLYEKLITGATTADEFIDNMYSFIEEVNDRYNEKIDEDVLYELCQKATENQQ